MMIDGLAVCDINREHAIVYGIKQNTKYFLAISYSGGSNIYGLPVTMSSKKREPKWATNSIADKRHDDILHLHNQWIDSRCYVDNSHTKEH